MISLNYSHTFSKNRYSSLELILLLEIQEEKFYLGLGCVPRTAAVACKTMGWDIET